MLSLSEHESDFSGVSVIVSFCAFLLLKSPCLIV